MASHYSPLLLLSCCLLFSLNSTAEKIWRTQKHTIQADILTDRLEHPWGMAFLPNGDLLVTERPGRLRLIKAATANAKLQSQPIAGLPPITAKGQGGLLDIVIDPDFNQNQMIYMSYSSSDDNGISTAVMRARLKDNSLSHVETIFRATRKSTGGRHFGSRLVLASDQTLYITLGDRGDRPRAQALDDHAGSVIRIHTDGTVPEDNPFIKTPNALPEIFSYGNRNVQGATLHPTTNELWTHEHGPQGGDEINIIRAGNNYGWPSITYGKNYVIGTRIGEGTHKPGMEQPLHYWTPSIAPSGMTFYTAPAFSNWQNNLFVGSLKFQQLVRLELKGDEVVHEERMLEGVFGRVRDVQQGPDGFIYLLTDQSNGKLVRLKPSLPP